MKQVKLLFGSHCLWARALVCFFSSLMMIASVSAIAQSTLPLLSIDQLTYEGGFRLRQNDYGASSMNYSQGPIAYNRERNSLFVVGHAHQQAIAEFPIPALVKSSNILDLRMAADPLQVFARVLPRVSGGNPQNLDRIGGMAVFDGPRGQELVVNAYEYYDTQSDTHTSFVIRNALDLAGSAIDGYLSFDGKTGHTAGWMSPIPAEWQAQLGGIYLTGASSGEPIISRWSVGPSAFVFNPASIVGNASVPNPIPTIKLLDFSLTNPLWPQADLFNDSRTNHLWTHRSRVVFGMIVPGTSTYLTLGNSEGHNNGICYKCVRSDGVLAGGYMARDAEDRYSFYWLWDVNDLRKVKEGTLASYDVRPYASGIFATPFSTKNYPLGGGSYDPDSGLLYLTVQGADKNQGTYSNPPVVVAYRIAAPNTNPKVTMTTPLNGGAVSGTVSLAAQVEGNFVTAGVQFLVDGIAVGAEDTSAPYGTSLNTTTLSNGTHTISANARDASGSNITSAILSIVVNNVIADTTPPVISNGSPASVLVANTTQIDLFVTTNELATCRYSVVNNVAFSSMPGLFSHTGSTAHSMTLNSLTNGSRYNYFVRCQDQQGNANVTDYAISFSVAVPNDTTPPQVLIGAPLANSTVSGAIALNATATDNVGVVGVQFRVDGQNFGVEDTSAPYSLALNTASLSDGVHSVSATARDAAGNQSTSTTVNFSVNNYVDQTPPTLSGGGPIGTLVFGTSQINMVVTTNETATCRYGVVSNTVFTNMPGVFNRITSSSHAITLTGLISGSRYSYFVRCQDQLGNTNTSDYAINFSVAAPPVDTTSPQVLIEAPVANSTVSGVITLNAIATDNVGVVGVQFRVDGQNFGMEDMTAPYSVPLNTASLSNGVHSIGAKARDAAGNRSSLVSINFSVNNIADQTPPVLSGGGPVAALPMGTTQVNMVIHTDEPATCRFDKWSSTTSYGNMFNDFTITGGTNHSVTLTVRNGSRFTRYIRCKDKAGNANIKSYPIFIRVIDRSS